MATRADIATRFRSAYRDDELLDVVRAVAVAAMPHSPLAVSTRRWDAAREHAGHPDAPSARRIVSRLNSAGRHVLSWPRIVEASFGTLAERRQTLSSAARRPEQHHLTVRHLVAALRRVAQHLGAHTVYRDQYEPACEAILAGLPSGAARDTVADLLPTLGQIERIARHECAGRDIGSDWGAALGLAGLIVSADAEDPQRGRKQALDPIEMIDLYGRLANQIPTFKQAKLFAARHQLALREADNNTWGAAVAAYKARLAASGERVPAGPIPRSRPRFDVPDGALDGLPRRYGRGQWAANPDLALDKLNEYLQALPAGQTPSTRHYRHVKQRDGRADWPALRVFGDYHGGFAAAVETVRRRRTP